MRLHRRKRSLHRANGSAFTQRDCGHRNQRRRLYKNWERHGRYHHRAHVTSGTCGVQGSPLTITRPLSGMQTVSLCVHGNGLDPTFTYAFTGPSDGDIPIVASAVTGLFPNTIELDLTISAATLPGVRSLFITSLNNDRAVATGILEVQ
jgi:hypothetical protein